MEKDKVFSGKIKQSGIFKFKDLYEFIYDFLMGENYDVFEDKYVEKISGDSKDVEINWKATREISDYFRFEIKADWVILGMKINATKLLLRRLRVIMLIRMVRLQK